MQVHRVCGYCWDGFDIEDQVARLYAMGSLDKHRKDQVKYCNRCRTLKSEFGQPSQCEFCKMISRFGEAKMCERCEKVLEKFGSMNLCERCGVNAGYRNIGDPEGKVGRFFFIVMINGLN